MFGEWDPFKIEMNREEVVAYLRERGQKPKGLSDEEWALVQSSSKDDPDPEYVSDMICDAIMNEYEGCLTLGWEGDSGHAHSGIKSVGAWEGLSYFTSSDHDDHGPFLDLNDALALEYFDQEGVPNGSLYFDAPPVPMERALEIAHAMCGEEGGRVDLNGVVHERQGDILVPIRETDEES